MARTTTTPQGLLFMMGATVAIMFIGSLFYIQQDYNYPLLPTSSSSEEEENRKVLSYIRPDSFSRLIFSFLFFNNSQTTIGMGKATMEDTTREEQEQINIDRFRSGVMSVSRRGFYFSHY